MARINRKHLRLHGHRWQLFRRLPPHVAAEWGRTFLVRSLGKVSLAEANRARDRIWQEVERLEEELAAKSETAERDYEARIIAELRELTGTPESDQMKLVLLDQAETMQSNGKDGLGFFKRVTGKQHRLTHFLDQWHASKRVRITTQLARRVALEQFADWVESETGVETANIETVSRLQAGEYVHHLQGRGLAPRTVNSQVSYLSAYWKFLMKRGIVEVNPWQGQSVAADQVINRKPWNAHEVVELIDNAPSEDIRNAIMLSALAGLRAVEIVNLKVGDCANGVLVVAEDYEGKTEAATRRVPIHSQLAPTIARLVVGRSANELLLPVFNGNRKLLTNKFCRYRKQQHGPGIERQAEKVFHSVRSFWSNSRLRAGCELRLVKELFGHKHQDVTQKHYYEGMTIEQARQVVEAVQLPIAAETDGQGGRESDPQ